MKLRVYLAEHNMKVKELSTLLECSQAYLSRILHGHVKPSKRLWNDIRRVTNNQVTLEEPELPTRIPPNRSLYDEDF